MNIYDALKTLGVTDSPVTEENVKTAYREACFKFHPDRNPAGAEMMKLVNEAKDSLKDASFPIEYKNDSGYNYGVEINEALNKIIHIVDLKIEVCGSWVWVSGNTKEHWPLLKESGFLFSPPKKMVYFRPEYSKKRRYKKDGLSIDEIRSKYGSKNVKNRKIFALQAHS